MTEFLPLCDVLFNVISLAGYFCDVVFDVVLGYALFERGRVGYFAIVLCLVLSSLLVSQIVSLRWYWSEVGKHKDSAETSSNSHHNGTLDKKDVCPSISYKRNVKFQRYTVVALHVVQLGVLWRYAKLFVPVDLRRVKHEVRDLCMLRLVHGFCEAAPMLLLQLYLLITIQTDSKFLMNTAEMKFKSLSGHSIVGVVSQQPAAVQQQAERTFKDLNIVSAVLSLFSVCWALASFSKNVRLQNVHRLVLTWLGVIFQFLWRLGTVTSRIASLTVYASFYNYWVFLVIILHWFSMLLWLISPKNVFHGERISRLRKTLLSALIAFVYVFAYINLQEVNHRQKMFTFYIVMFLENSLLVCLWMVGVWPNKPSQWYLVPILVLSAFALGMFFMVLYYRYFHVRRLGYENGGRYPTCGIEVKDNSVGSKSISNRHNDQPPIAGVFNCRFSNPVGSGATKRKKKKPTTFIPPPTLGFASQLNSESPTINGPMPIPFWRRPLSQSQSSENEGSVGSRVNIHQKLQEKKQKQLAELKIIEEEIKQGKLGGPATNTLGSGDDGRTSLPRQPIPRAKKHINLDPIEWCTATNMDLDKRFNDLDEINNLNKFTSQFDNLYSSFGLSGINIPALEQPNVRNISPIPSSQVSGAENNSLTRQVLPRTKMLHNGLRNPFTDSYRNVVTNQPTPLNQRNVTSSPVRNTMFDHLNHQNIFLEINHPRQISGTYSSSTENANPGADNLPFPYNVIPPPRSKLDSKSTPPTPSLIMQPQNQSTVANKLTQRQMQRAKTPEILLAPHYLDNSRVYYDWVGRETAYRIQESDRNQTFSSGDENLDISAADESIIAERNGNHAPSDIDSQVSLPRSYTLPREFKYYRRNKIRKFNKNEHFITSTNSSDGDVDSADDNESERHSDTSQCRIRLQQQQNSRKIQNNFHNHPQPTTSSSISASTNNPHQLRNNRNNFISSPINQPRCNGSPNNHMHPTDVTVNNLDLISGVESNLNNNIFPIRQSRLKVYGANKHGMMPWRHETKL
ncbi:unnamed protein product [Hermetia illucens]|uniref:XK-related protein n=2 Tax=Hermetia illucens TaxID=343691 RepID=A0A7R8UYA0_HERIL|nr:unnamed protein product [Hermetia illucens]